MEKFAENKDRIRNIPSSILLPHSISEGVTCIKLFLNTVSHTYTQQTSATQTPVSKKINNTSVNKAEFKSAYAELIYVSVKGILHKDSLNYIHKIHKSSTNGISHPNLRRKHFKQYQQPNQIQEFMDGHPDHYNKTKYESGDITFQLHPRSSTVKMIINLIHFSHPI